MKNKILLCGLIIVIMALVVALGYTNARYYSTVAMTGDLDYIKNLGEISIYNPSWIGNYDTNEDGSITFKFSPSGLLFTNIHYSVINKVNDVINEEETIYYIRIVAEDGSNNIPIEYDVHEYNTPNNILNYEEGVGYGPFTLNASTEETQYYSIKANWVSSDSKHMTAEQHLKVQMVKKREGGLLKVIDEDILNVKYTGGAKEMHATIQYRDLSTNPIGSDSIKITTGTTIDFTNENQLKELGITIPAGYAFDHIMSALTTPAWQPATQVTIPENQATDPYIDVYCVAQAKISVEFTYYKYASSGNIKIEEATQTLDIPRGVDVNFKDSVQCAAFGIILPEGYEFYAVTSDQLQVGSDSFKIPEDTTETKVKINVILKTIEKIAIVRFFDSAGTLKGSSEVSMSTGSYTFTTAICRTLCPALSNMTSFTIYNTIEDLETGEIKSNSELGNTHTNGSVNVAYESYGPFIDIKAWW